VKRAVSIVLVVAAVIVLIWMLARVRSSSSRAINSEKAGPEATVTNVLVTASSPDAIAPPNSAGRLLGESILRDYANANQPPENDLTLMSRLMENSLLLLKSAGNRPLSANEDWADFLLGKNFIHERFLTDTNVALNAQGQLIDRWRTPLFVHALGGGRYEMRSAGPDQKLWTADDIHRNADGSFRRGPDLNSPSLMESATRGRSPATAP
jgi:hypothetical protein